MNLHSDQKPKITIEVSVSVIHSLKIEPVFFASVSLGVKKAELRKNDRNFQCGDFLLLREWEKGGYTGVKLIVKVTHVLPVGKFIDDGSDWVVLSITFVSARDAATLFDAKFGGEQ
ncbi:DUF3850 domain-containing protein [Serratia fonticola]|uniref:DUF3850 domain-containing protein n=1 Tax=Serratia fonticola TaxID=47917 RepID=UPI000E2E0739|nr:DUF3850 domain-containing protein [Serratia fonticola]RDL15932.1 uncharacterized protein DUF3850 [Serratia fonticola]